MLILQLTTEEVRQIIKDEIALALTAIGRKEDDDLLTRKETAKYLGVTLPTLSVWEKRDTSRPHELALESISRSHL